ncbi:hypothetical protein AAC387_Pa06g1094 [Persea americana]
MRVGTLISDRLNPPENRVLICCYDGNDRLRGSALEEEPMPEAVAVIEGGWRALRVQNLGVGCGSWSGLGEKWGWLVSFPANDWDEERRRVKEGGGRRGLCDKRGILVSRKKYKGME